MDDQNGIQRIFDGMDLGKENQMSDISPHYKFNPTDARILRSILNYEGTPTAITVFGEYCDALTDYAYWFALGTLWVSYSGFSDLELWKRLFSSTRRGREACLMKPSELATFSRMPPAFKVYRAHREGETDWIAYTFDATKAAEFAAQRNITKIAEYRVNRMDILALFLRRGEKEIIILDKSKAVKLGERIVL